MTSKEIDQKLTEIQDYDDRLDEWEHDFIDEIIDVFEAQGQLSEAQEETISQIYYKLNI